MNLPWTENIAILSKWIKWADIFALILTVLAAVAAVSRTVLSEKKDVAEERRTSARNVALSANVKNEILSHLRLFKGTEIAINGIRNDHEALGFASDLRSLFREAEWNVTADEGPITSSEIGREIIVWIPLKADPAAAATLISAFKRLNYPVIERREDVVRFQVYVWPHFYRL
jgi:hypothetical protein